MPLPTDLNKQFVYAPLLILALILGMGSFLWHSSLHREMLDRIDSELQLTASTLDYLQQVQPLEETAITTSCEWTAAPLSHLLDEWHFARFTPGGHLICLSSSGAHLQIVMPDNPPPDKKTFFFTTSQGETRRALLWPVKNTDQISAYQLLSIDLTSSTTQMLRWRLVLLLGSVLFLAATALYFRHLRRKQQDASLNELIKRIENSGPDHPPQPFPTDQIKSTELRQLADSCYQLNQRMFSALHRARQFDAHVAHELRTPLTILRGETEIALRSKQESHDIQQVLESNLEEITRMGFLVDDLLTLSKSDLGEIPLQPGSIHLNHLLADLQRQGQVLAREKEILIELDCKDDDIIIHADELRLRQGLLNLLTNAIRYTPTQGVVTMTAEVTESAVTIAVSDTGIGIETHHLEHIFEKFYRVDKKFHHYDGGTGLGLAIVKWVVDAHHGTIDVSSHPGKGSRFTMNLPRNQNDSSKERR